MNTRSTLAMQLYAVHQILETCIDQQDFHSNRAWIDGMLTQTLEFINVKLKNRSIASEFENLRKLFNELRIKFLSKCHLEKCNILNLGVTKHDVNNVNVRSLVTLNDVHIEQFGWNLSPQKLREIWECFCRRNLIKCEFELFEKHFYGGEITLDDRLKWRKSTRLLARWLFRLKEAGIVQSDAITPTNIIFHFCDKTGLELNYNTLRAQPGVRMSNKVERDIDMVIKLLLNP